MSNVTKLGQYEVLVVVVGVVVVVEEETDTGDETLRLMLTQSSSLSFPRATSKRSKSDN